ncbi:MAG: L-glutamate gamma-semialdehyde dehydrogenase [Pseudobdellovibrionaceae bacterium]|jgi:RHH-type proline utilization regulon transcriptional repressor/proline dehydrogenase/delta 1-pyrroline-5-carboxylate dehydrogenase|nr:L-glutamate gamma-semialdehyde dehydrogenase [Pseudobdellovibrionaceae bacterium]
MTTPVSLPPYDQHSLEDVLSNLLAQLKWDKDRSARIRVKAGAFIEQIRKSAAETTEIETFLQHYSLTSPEGRALMTLAESLLRIPDAATADLLIAEKLLASDWKQVGGENFLMKGASKGLGLAKSALGMGSIVGAIGKPVIRKAMIETVKGLGSQFVLGRTIEEALSNGESSAAKKGYRCSFDILGEGARTAEDAERYFKAYIYALDKISAAANLERPLEARHGMSVKLSALHPRYHWYHAETCVPAISEKLLKLAEIAAQKGVTLTVDAEESERLELSLQIINDVLSKLENKDWRGFGLAIQAYDRRAPYVIDKIEELSETYGVKLQIRLVKGAYWDGEIKRAQVGSWNDYPVFQRKSQTDLSYLTCAQKLLGLRGRIYPMFATHNAYTAAAILELAGENREGFEFQRLHGMGSSLGDILLTQEKLPVTIYAPVGPYEDLLPYLVRRMLENGANASFVSKLRDPETPLDVIAADPVARVKQESAISPLPRPAELYGETRKNSRGYDLSVAKHREVFFSKITSPVVVSTLLPPSDIDRSFSAAKEIFPDWSGTSAEVRANLLRKASDLVEFHTSELMNLLGNEAKKTVFDAIAEIREAVDFLRYYAELAEKDFSGSGVSLIGPTGELNRIRLGGRGTFICISPWNFPLAIFLGQVSAALAAGNCVIAKPAEQTPRIAKFAVDLLHKAGIPEKALQIMVGDGELGAKLVAHKDVAGVAFTGSTAVAQIINRTLAEKVGPIVPLIAETGGQNAMIVDSTALPEQVVDDVILSAFGSAGQRCSALRVLYLQDETADKIIELLKGAMLQVKVGTATDPSSDISQIIDEEAQSNLERHITYLDSFARKIAEIPTDSALKGTYFAPRAYEIDNISRLSGEVFGPILHIIRYRAENFETVIHDINSTGFGLTFGVHSRLERRFVELSDKIKAGNIYINRSMIGAVVGVQPFGGQGLSGTGPKAGGPHYLHRFAIEQSVSDNITASGGNLALISRNLD